MAEVIPVAPDNDEVADGGGAAFDEDILAEIEQRLDSEDETEAMPLTAGEKVELDKADLPPEMDISPKKETEPGPGEPKVEVDLAEEAEAWFSELQEGQATGAEPGGKRRLVILSLVLAAVLLVGGGAFGIYWYMEKPEAKQEVVENVPYRVQGPVPDPALTLRLDLKPFLVPLMKSSQGRILKVGVTLEVSDPQSKVAIGQYTYLCRDVIYRLLRDRPAGEIKTARAKRLLQAQIKTELNHALKETMVQQVFFTEFVITG